LLVVGIAVIVKRLAPIELGTQISHLLAILRGLL
jgi:hypothetical protein